jgi:putative transposase
LRNITAGWSQRVAAWESAMNQFRILYEDRFTNPVLG